MANRDTALRSRNQNILGKSFSYLDLYNDSGLAHWDEICARCREIGFDYVALPPPFAPGPQGDAFLTGDIEYAHPALARLADRARSARTVDVIETLSLSCRKYGLGIVLDIVIDRADAKGVLVTDNRELFDDALSESLNPRSLRATAGAAAARFDDASQFERLIALWVGCLGALLTVGAGGFRFMNPGAIAAPAWGHLNTTLRDAFPKMISLANTPGTAWEAILGLRACAFDGAFCSLPWWDMHSSWLTEEINLLRQVGYLAAAPRVLAPDRDAFLVADATRDRQRLHIAAEIADALFVPMDSDSLRHSGAAQTLELREAIEQFARVKHRGTQGEMQALCSAGGAITALVDRSLSNTIGVETAVVTLINRNLSDSEEVDVPFESLNSISGAAFGYPSRLDGSSEPLPPLEPGEVRVVKLEPLTPIKLLAGDPREALERAIRSPRIVIDAVEPSVDGGAFPARCVTGDALQVSADIFCDGHPVIAAEILWQGIGDANWQRAPLKLGYNDRWTGAFSPHRIGPHRFTVEAWIDEFAGLLRDLEVKQKAGVVTKADVLDAKAFVQSLSGVSAKSRAKLENLVQSLDGASVEQAVAALTDDTNQDTIRAAQPRRFSTRAQPIPLDVERQKAVFSSWYELFPRSASPVAGRHGTFDDVIARLPQIRAMGFDVLYLTPIHPVGRVNRKGRNNSLVSAPDDPGSPYAIGAAEGGHDAIHGQLGSFEDFARLIEAALDEGLELALDFAVQCAPDHPWLKEHKDWFRWRADGSMRFAENPPKKYEDIVNVEFYAEPDVAALWTALRDIVLFWVERGVNIFRVDNPHTKPLPFWKWLISDIRARYPEVIFLSEAFTRPKMMYRLAKVGFSQSYTYFTWRNTKREITDYVSELTASPAADFFRPHFFVNTPDINPFFLQNSGRAGFLIRAVLASTLSGLWGVYSGYELCEAAALPGREEYLDSEKYELKPRDYDAPGNIKAEITTLNAIRVSNRALQSHRGIKFYNAFNDEIIAYGRRLPATDDMIFIMVNLDAHNVQEATFEMPLWEWNLGDEKSLRVEDLLHPGEETVWTGKLQRVRLDPAISPYAIWRFASIDAGRA
jgi:starch synthase (maltosyl-transferring)